jgi:hypothetical protein
VEQRRRVQQLDGRRHLDAARTGVAAELGRQQHEGGPQPLAPRAEHVPTEIRNQVRRRRQLFPHGALDELELGVDSIGGAEEGGRRGRGRRHRGRR